jgi:uncharacterized protein (DUF58 family)
MMALLRDPGPRRRPGLRTTTEGKFFIVVTFLIGFAAYNTATNLLYLIFSMLLSLLVVSALMSQSTLRGLRVSRLVPTHIVAGEEATIHLSVRNTKRWFPSLSLRLADVLRTGRIVGQAYAVRVSAGKTFNLAYAVIFQRRGRYLFDRLLVTTRYPFGFIEKSTSVPTAQEILVYPTLVDMAAELTESQLDLGEIETGRRGLGSSLHGLREYQPGDPARHIHWRVTAKTGDVIVREFENEEKKRVTIVLDNVGDPMDAPLSEVFERAVVFTASLAKFLNDRDYQIQLLTREGRVPFGSGVTHLHRLLRCLAIVDLSPEPGVVSTHQGHDAADSTSLYVQFRRGPSPAGFDQVLDTTQWHPEEHTSAVMRSAA